MAATDVANTQQENGHTESIPPAIIPVSFFKFRKYLILLFYNYFLQKRHMLRQSWTYWYLNDNRSMNWEDRLKKICTFNTVEDFWA